MASKVVPQGIQNNIRADVIESIQIGAEVSSTYGYRPTDSGTLIVIQYDDEGNETNQYELLFVVIPKQSAIHTEVRNG